MRKTLLFFLLLFLATQFTACAKMRILTIPSRDNADIYINGKQVSRGTADVSDAWRVRRTLNVEARGSNGCIARKKVTSKFSGGLCALNILTMGLAGFSIGTSATIVGGNIGEGMLFGSLIGLAIGGVACPIFSWKLPEVLTLEVDQCGSPPTRQRNYRRNPTPKPPERLTFPPPTRPRAGCQKDTDCKGKRICENGRCLYPRNR